jgi:hypothetical protein
MPIFLAYTVFAVVYFGAVVPRFQNFQNALVTLFAVLNGDVIRETFMSLMPRCARNSSSARASYLSFEL